MLIWKAREAAQSRHPVDRLCRRDTSIDQLDMSSTPLPQPLLPSLGQILLSPFRQEGHSWKFVLAFALLATVGLVIMVPHGQDKVATIMATIWCGDVWMAGDVHPAAEPPFAARLVPGHVRRLKLVLMGAWQTSIPSAVAFGLRDRPLQHLALLWRRARYAAFGAGARWWPLWIVMAGAHAMALFHTLKGAWQSTLRSSIDARQAA